MISLPGKEVSNGNLATMSLWAKIKLYMRSVRASLSLGRVNTGKHLSIISMFSQKNFLIVTVSILRRMFTTPSYSPKEPQPTLSQFKKAREKEE